ncbi:MAG: cytochrome c-type biogenesis protein CcmH [Rhodoferax sp.]|nr:cytochrome c-type biogenesis protein CcmH [Rhodoferax sp.]MCF8209514.1 cytochrome c-type biogenesis protein CcmH [Rhodoferax sp.]
MKYLYLIVLLLLGTAAAWGKEAAPLAEDPAVEQRLIVISEEMRCLVCQNESLAGSRSELALDLRRELRTLIKQGKTDDEIREFMVSRYGDFVLYRPPVKPITWMLWIGPFVLMVAGVAALFVYMRRRNQEVVRPELTDEERKRAEALLKEGEK